MEADVHVVNQPGSPATFVSHSGSTFIDVTLATHPGEIRDWGVIVTENDQDHRLITFKQGYGTRSGTANHGPSRYVERKADWETFRRKLEGYRTALDDATNSVDVDEWAATMTEVVTGSCDASMPQTRKSTFRAVPWWSSDIEAARTEVRKARRRYQRTRDESTRSLLRESYVRAKRALTRQIRRIKLESWREFVTKIGNDNPWGAVYRYYGSGKSQRGRNVLESLRRREDCTCTETVPQTLK